MHFSRPLLLLSLSLGLALLPISSHAQDKPAKPISASKVQEEADGWLMAADKILSGQDKGKTLADAMKLLEKASDANHAPSQLALARLLQRGGGKELKADPERAEFLLQQAAEAGLASAQSEYGGLLYSKIDPKGRDLKYDEPLAWFKKAAAQNDPEGLARLGSMTMSGEGGVKADPEAGFKLLQQAAQKGHSLALNECGVCFQRGNGTAKDEIAAVGYLTAAADLGNIAAMVNLGASYRYGNGVPASATKAGNLFAAAAKRRFPAAQLMLGEMLEAGEGTAAHPLHAAINYHNAAEGGIATAKERAAALVAKFSAAEKKAWEEYLKTGVIPEEKDKEKASASAGASAKPAAAATNANGRSK